MIETYLLIIVFFVYVFDEKRRDSHASEIRKTVAPVALVSVIGFAALLFGRTYYRFSEVTLIIPSLGIIIYMFVKRART